MFDLDKESKASSHLAEASLLSTSESVSVNESFRTWNGDDVLMNWFWKLSQVLNHPLIKICHARRLFHQAKFAEASLQFKRMLGQATSQEMELYVSRMRVLCGLLSSPSTRHQLLFDIKKDALNLESPFLADALEWFLNSSDQTVDPRCNAIEFLRSSLPLRFTSDGTVSRVICWHNLWAASLQKSSLTDTRLIQILNVDKSEMKAEDCKKIVLKMIADHQLKAEIVNTPSNETFEVRFLDHNELGSMKDAMDQVQFKVSPVDNHPSSDFSKVKETIAIESHLQTLDTSSAPSSNNLTPSNPSGKALKNLINSAPSRHISDDNKAVIITPNPPIQTVTQALYRKEGPKHTVPGSVKVSLALETTVPLNGKNAKERNALVSSHGLFGETTIGSKQHEAFRPWQREPLNPVDTIPPPERKGNSEQAPSQACQPHIKQTMQQKKSKDYYQEDARYALHKSIHRENIRPHVNESVDPPQTDMEYSQTCTILPRFGNAHGQEIKSLATEIQLDTIPDSPVHDGRSDSDTLQFSIPSHSSRKRKALQKQQLSSFGTQSSGSQCLEPLKRKRIDQSEEEGTMCDRPIYPVAPSIGPGSEMWKQMQLNSASREFSFLLSSSLATSLENLRLIGVNFDSGVRSRSEEGLYSWGSNSKKIKRFCQRDATFVSISQIL